MFDYAIIGSGVSGGRAAYNLSKLGAKCVLIEAGNEFNKKTFPRAEMDYSTQLFWGGGVEITSDGNLGLLRAKTLGGGSIVNQALVDRFDDLAWDDWKTRTGIQWMNAVSIDPFYSFVEGAISIQTIPTKNYNRNAQIFTQSSNKLGRGWKALRRAQSDCALDQGMDCIQCLGGCPRDSKQSSLVTTIRKARELGLVVVSGLEIQEIKTTPDHVVLFGIQGTEKKEFIAQKVVLAGGSLGNTKILMNSGFGKKLPALGKYFSCHPQFMSYGLFDEPVDSHKGAFQSVKSDDARMRKSGFKLENVFAPPIGTAMLVPGIGRAHQRMMMRYRYFSTAEVATRDDNHGEIRIHSSGKILVKKPFSKEDLRKRDEGLKLVAELFKAAGAKKVLSCKQGFGLHLMGGCVLGTNEKTSVVNPEFKLHGNSRICIADSSVFPSAPGINPSLTIMALSHKATKEGF